MVDFREPFLLMTTVSRGGEIFSILKIKNAKTIKAKKKKKKKSHYTKKFEMKEERLVHCIDGER